MCTLKPDELKELKELAETGTRAVVVIGKVTGQTRYAARDGRPAEVVCATVVSEGKSWNLKFQDGDTLPGRGFEGAFAVDPGDLYQGKNGVNIACIGFA